MEIRSWKLEKGAQLTKESKIEIAKEVFRAEIECGLSEKEACKAVGVNLGSFRNWRKKGNKAEVSEVSTLFAGKRGKKKLSRNERILESAKTALEKHLNVECLKTSTPKGDIVREVLPEPKMIMEALKAHDSKVYGDNKEKEAVEVKGGLTVPADMVNPFFSEIVRKVTTAYEIYKYILLVAGARVGKTRVFIDIIINWLVTGEAFGRQLQNKAAIILRPTFESMRHTVLKDIKARIIERGLNDLIDYNQSDKKFSYEDRYITYTGVDKPIDNFLGSEWSMCWANECNFANEENLTQIFARTEGKILVDGNTIELVGWIPDLEGENNVYKRVIKLDENLYLNEDIKKAMLDMGEKDPYYKAVFLEAKRVPRKGRVYNNWVVGAKPAEYDHRVIGIDFGTLAPVAMAEVFVSRGAEGERERVFVRQLAYTPSLSMSRVADIIIRQGCPAVADSASPNLIGEINLNLEEKGSDLRCFKAFKSDVAEECAAIESTYDLVIDKDSPDLQMEIQMYGMAVIRNIQTDIPLKNGKDHLLDALRYALMQYYRIRLKLRKQRV